MRSLLGARISRYGLLSDGGSGGSCVEGDVNCCDGMHSLGNKLQKQKRRLRELTRLVERNLELTRAVAEKMEVLGGADSGAAGEESDANESSEASSATGSDAIGMKYASEETGTGKRK